ncbi:hypothetical protein TNCV_1899341 [Trichonephila clavipes]|nr:hypothetical protein TNCV_1899341 [Trichonephila clavipes]
MMTSSRLVCSTVLDLLLPPVLARRNHFHRAVDVTSTWKGFFIKAVASLPLLLATPYIRCMPAVSLLVKSPIMIEFSSANANFVGVADHWHTTLLSSTIANIVCQSRHKVCRACMTVGGSIF